MSEGETKVNFGRQNIPFNASVGSWKVEMPCVAV